MNEENFNYNKPLLENPEETDIFAKPLKPKKIIFVSDLPKTRNAKVMRRMVRAAYLDLDLGDTSSLVNPQILDEIRSKK